MNNKIFTLFFILLISVYSSIAQQKEASSAKALEATDKLLQNLKIDESTPEDVIKILGKPVSDNFDDFAVGGKNGIFETSITPLFLTISNEKIFRKLVYGKIGETDDITFRFYEGKLFQIIFDYDLGRKAKKFPAIDLGQKYGIDFVILQGVTKDSKITDFEGQKENSLPKVYGVLYTVLSVQKDVIYFVRIDNNNSKGFWKNIAGRATKEMFPGFLGEMHLISRRLEKK